MRKGLYPAFIIPACLFLLLSTPNGLSAEIVNIDDLEGGAIEPPPVPSGLTASDAEDTRAVILHWNNVEGGANYKVFRSTSEEGPKNSLTPPATGDPSYGLFWDYSATPGVKYWYWVASLRYLASHQYFDTEKGYFVEFIYSDFSSTDTGFRKLQPPENVNATKGTSKDNVAIWWRGVWGASSYRIYRRESAFADGNEIGFIPSAAGSATQALYDTSAKPGTKYYYWVRTETDVTYSDASNTAVGQRAGIPPAPTDVIASDGWYPDKIRITWQPIEFINEYDVYRSESGRSTSTLKHSGGRPIYVGKSNTALFNDTFQIKADIPYTYWVKAVNPAGISDFSAPDTGYLPATVHIPAPSGVTASDGTYSDRVVISWNPLDDANRYQVFRSNNSTLETGEFFLLAEFSGNYTAYYEDRYQPNPGTTYWYWIRVIKYGEHFPYISAYSTPDSGYSTQPGKIATSLDSRLQKIPVQQSQTTLASQPTQKSASTKFKIPIKNIQTGRLDLSRTPARQQQAVQRSTVKPVVITISSGRTTKVLIPGKHSNSPTRLATIPRSRGDRIRVAGGVRVKPAEPNRKKTGRFYLMDVAQDTPAGYYQLQLQDKSGRWLTVSPENVQIRIVPDK